MKNRDVFRLLIRPETHQASHFNLWCFHRLDESIDGAHTVVDVVSGFDLEAIASLKIRGKNIFRGPSNLNTKNKLASGQSFIMRNEEVPPDAANLIISGSTEIGTALIEKLLGARRCCCCRCC